MKHLQSALSICFLLCCLFAAPLCALPEVREVEEGSAVFEYPDQSTLTIRADDKTVINFTSFDIAQNELVNFIQPSSFSTVLSRVTGPAPSEISGTLTANGILFLVNPNGIHFAPTADVRVNTLIASTLGISTNDFIKGTYAFEHLADAKYARVANEGGIIAEGSAALIGSAVANSGVIVAKAGTVHLASGDKAAVAIDARGWIHVEIDERVSAKVFDMNGVPVKDAVANSGRIEACQVVMSAKTAADIFENAVNQTGVVKATKLVNENGVIKILSNERIQASGALEAKGGAIEILSGDSIEVSANLATAGDTKLAADKDIAVSADITTDSGNLELLADADLDGAGSFRQKAGTTVSTVNFGDITIQSSGEGTLANIDSSGDLILRPGGAPAVFTQQPGSHIVTKGSFMAGPGVTLNAGNALYELGKDWRFSGTFNPFDSTVSLISELSAYVAGSNTFNNFSISVPGKIVKFDGDSTQTILGTLTLKGGFGNLLELRSITPPQQWKILPTAETDIQYVLVGDSINIRGPPLKGLHSSSLGNLTNWDLDPIWTGGGANNNWSTGLNWDTGVAPTAFDAVTFDGVTGVNPNKASTINGVWTGSIASLTINGYTNTITQSRSLTISGAYSQSTGTYNAGAQTITVAGDFTINGGTFTAGTGTIVFNGTSNLTSNNTALNIVTIGTATTGGSLTLVDNADFNGNLTFDNTGGATSLNLNGKTLNFAGAQFNLTNADTFNAAGSTVIFDRATATTLTSAGKSFNNVQIGSATSAGLLTLGDQADFNGNLTVADGGATTFTISNRTLYFSGLTFNLTNLDTFTVTGSTAVFDGTTNLTSAGLAFLNVTIGTDTASGSLTLTDSADLNGNLAFNTTGGTADFNLNGQTLNFAGATFDLTNADTFNAAGSTVIFDRTTATTLTSAGKSFNKVQIGSVASGGRLTLGDQADFNGDLTVNNGGTTVFVISNQTLLFSGSVLDLTNLDTFTMTNSTAVFDGATNLTSAGLAFNNVTIGTDTASGVLTLIDNADFNGSLTFNTTGGTAALDLNSKTLNFAGSAFNLTSADTFNSTGSTVIFDGTVTVTSAGKSFNIVQLGGGGNVTLILSDTADFNGDFSVAAGGTKVLDITNQTVNFSGATLNLTNLDTFTVAGSTFIFDGTTSLTCAGRSFNNVIIGTNTASGSLTLAAAGSISGDLTFNTTGGITTLDLNGQTLTFAGSQFNLTNADTFSVAGSTVVFSGTTTLTNAGKSFETVQLGANGQLTIADQADFNGAFSVASGGTTLLDITGQTVNFSGATLNLTNLDTFTVTGSTFIFDGTTSLTCNGASRTFNNIIIGTNAASGALTLANAGFINGDLTFNTTGGTAALDLNGQTLTFAGSQFNLTNADTFSVAGSTVVFSGTTTLTSAGKAFNIVQIGANGSLTLGDQADFDGAFSVSATGTTVFDISGQTLYFSGATLSLTNLDTFTTAGSTVVFDGTTSLTSAGMAFNIVQIGSAAAGGSLTLADSADINGNLTVTNAAATTFIVTNRTILFSGPALDLTNLDTFTVTGSTFTFDGATSLTSAGLAFNTVTVGTNTSSGSLTLVDNADFNGSLTFNTTGGTADLDLNGKTLNFAGAAFNLTNADTFSAAGSTVIFDGTTSVTSAGKSFDIIQLGSAVAGCSVTLADQADINGNLTVTNAAATTFIVTNRTVLFSGAALDLTNLDTFTVGGSTFVFDGTVSLTSAGLAFNNIQIGSATAGGSLTLADQADFNGDLAVNDGGATAFDISGRTVLFSGTVFNLTNLDTFTVAGSTVTFDKTGTTNTVLTSAGHAFNNIQLGGDADLTISDQADINGDFSLTGAGTSELVITNQTVYFSGTTFNLTGLDTFTVTNSTAVFDGATNLTSAGLAFNNVTIGTDTASGALTLVDNADFNGSLTFNTTGGTAALDLNSKTLNFAGSAFNLTNADTFNSTGATIIFDGTVTVTSAGKSFDCDIQIGSASAGANVTFSDQTDLNANLAVNNGGATTLNVTNQTVNFSGATLNLTNLDTFTVAGSTVIFDGTTSLTCNGSSRAFNNVTIGTNAASGALTLANAGFINGDLAFNTTGGTAALDLNGQTLTFAGSQFNLTNADTFSVAGSTVVFDGVTTLTSAGKPFNNVQISNSGSLTLADQADFDGTFSIAGGGGTSTFDMTNQTLLFSGSAFSLANLDVFNNSSSTINFDGAGAQTLTSGGTGAGKIFNNLTHSGAGTLQLITNNVNIDGNFNNSGGTFDANGRTMTVAGNWSNSAAFDANLGTVTFDGAGTSTISGSATFYNLTCSTAGKTISFTRGTTQTVTHTLTLTGAVGNQLIINDAGIGALPKLELQAGGTQSISSVNVTNNDATGGLQLVARGSSTLSPTALNWMLGSDGVTITWTGVTSTNWNTASNWDLGIVPGAADTIVIPAGTPFQPGLVGAVTVGGLTIDSGTTLTTNNNTLTINGDLVIDGTLNAGLSIVTLSGGNLTTHGGGLLQGTSPSVSASGFMGTKDSPLGISMTGVATLSASGMSDLVSISITGGGQPNFIGALPGFVMFNGYIMKDIGQVSFAALLRESTSMLYQGGAIPRFPDLCKSLFYRCDLVEGNALLFGAEK